MHNDENITCDIYDPDWVVEHKGTYNGYDYYVRLGKDHGCRCGYVRTPQGVPEHVYFLEVHGSVTYVADDDSELGFDCAHCLDAPDADAVRKHFGQEAADRLRPAVPGAEVRSLEYVIEQCKKLIDQLPPVLMNKYVCEACAGQQCRAQSDKRPQRCLHYEKEPCWCEHKEQPSTEQSKTEQ